MKLIYPAEFRLTKKIKLQNGDNITDFQLGINNKCITFTRSFHWNSMWDVEYNIRFNKHKSILISCTRTLRKTDETNIPR